MSSRTLRAVVPLGPAPRRTAPVVAVAALLFALILAARWHVPGPAEAIALLFSIPITLLAVTLGTRGGTCASAVAVALLAGWALRADVQLTALGWAARITPLVLLGALLGAVVDRLRRADAERHRLATVAEHHRQAVLLNDSVVQGLTAAKWSLEAGDADKALQLVSETLDLGHQLVSDLIRNSGLTSSWTGGRPDQA